MTEHSFSGRFDLPELIKRFPETAETMLLDHYIADSPSRSVRLFRVYHAVPPHFHRQCDEVLFMLSGKGRFWIGDQSREELCMPGQLIIFPRLEVHAIPGVVEGPVVFLAIDTPRRAPDDVVFVNPEDGNAAQFIRAV